MRRFSNCKGIVANLWISLISKVLIKKFCRFIGIKMCKIRRSKGESRVWCVDAVVDSPREE